MYLCACGVVSTAMESKTTQVEASDIIRVILQFLKESNLKRSLQCLQEESSVALQTVDSLEAFQSDVMKGKWDSVVSTVGTMYVPEETLHILYEHIVCELIELREITAAQTLLRETTTLQSLKVTAPERYRRLELLLAQPQMTNSRVDPKELYGGTSKEKRRGALWKVLSRHVQQAPPSRLVTLLGMALKWQNLQGLIPAHGTYDLLRGVTTFSQQQYEEPSVERIARTVKFGKKTPAQCVVFSPDGRYVTTGSTDGLIEIWDWTTGLLATDFEYQQKDMLLAHETAVLALAYSKDFSLLATGSKAGDIKVWRVATGQCLAKFAHAHDDALACISFNADNSQLLTGSYDFTARLHGLQSVSTLRQFTGHTSYVTSAVFYGSDGNRVLTGSTDGHIKFWDARTGDCLITFSPPCPSHKNEALTIPINSIILPPKTATQFPEGSFFVCTKSTTVYLMNEAGQVLKRYCPQLGETCADFVGLTVSHKGAWLYCATEDHMLWTFSTSAGATAPKDPCLPKAVHDQDILGLAAHPFQSVLATIAFDGNMHILQP